MVLNKINLNKLTIKRVIRDYNIKLIYMDRNMNHYKDTWKLDNDNLLSSFRNNFYIRTLKAVDKKYNNQNKTLAKEYTAIKRRVHSQFFYKIIGLELTNKKKEYDLNKLQEKIIIYK